MGGLSSRQPVPARGSAPAGSPAPLPLATKPPILRSPSPRTGLSPTGTTPQPATRGPGVPSFAPVTPRKKSSVPAEYHDTVPEEYEEKIKKPKSSGHSQGSTQDSRPQTPMSDTSGRISIRASPKLVRAGSRIFERLQYFEERRRTASEPPAPRVPRTPSSQGTSGRKGLPPKTVPPGESTHVIQHLALSSVALVGSDGEPEPGGQRGRKAPVRGSTAAGQSTQVEDVGARKGPQQEGTGEVKKKEQWLLAQATSQGRVALSQAGPARGSPCPDGSPAGGARR
ncbi:PREDICTED: striated muscle-specific serine/threonine-protein kinase-like [Chaetura pelagica]|uniref:striated muscle-specific serine/threonine-protein kinase-like n=1 Tax=Chaetura pelagica TaxID=8897 RepID=UPI000523DCA5|nr:PREDICTED: striated muscle-specific serine/threonine-protein kinase-like [Chaetura pelagica]